MPQRFNRRDFLALAGLGAGALATSLGPRALASGAARRSATAAASGFAATGDATERLLVVIEMAGGNDGLSMAPPVDAARLADYRGEDWDESAFLRPGHDLVLHPAFERLQHRPLTIVDGLGAAAPDGSHFEMLRRWWTGDVDGTAHPATGFLGRLCDALDAGAPVTGLSIGGGSSPALVAERAGTLGLPDPGWLWWLTPDAESDDDADPWMTTFRDGLAAMSVADDEDSETLAAARRGLDGGLRAGQLIGGLDESSQYPGSGLGGKLALASQLLAADVGVRVVHVSMGGDFDTHENHFGRHSALMAELDEALDTFLDDLAARDLADRVLVATVSEFGRRPELNGSGGLDHGTASVGLLAGAVGSGRVGEPLDLDQLDDDDNFVATTLMDQYYATLAETWFGVPAGDVLPTSPTPLPL